MYSFHETQEDFDRFYNEAKDAYLRVYTRCGLTAKATEASGGSFTEKLSYEFMVLTDAGEDDILYCDHCAYCVNVEISDQKADDACTRCGKGTLARATASEVGNIFDLGMKYAKDFSLTFKTRDGQEKHPIMGCFGIGITRLMGVIAEALSDEKGVVWPASVAPFAVHLVSIAGSNPDVATEADRLYELLAENGIEVLYDDRDLRAGEKFADADLLGIPTRVVVSEKTIAAGGAEVADRKSGTASLVPESELVEHLK
jgi:prolyl-tRNA synthetase